MLRDNVVGGEPGRCGLELLVAELNETRPRVFFTFAPIICHQKQRNRSLLNTKAQKRKGSEKKYDYDDNDTEIRGFEDGGFKVGVEPAERELGATGSH